MPVNSDFIQYIQTVLGPQTDAFLKAMDRSPSVSVRLNPRKKAESLPFSGEKVAWCDDCGLYLESRPVFTLMPQMHAGGVYVQDASSMFYRHIFSQIQQDDSFPAAVLDMCAAPGGKSSAIIDAMPRDTIVVSNEFAGKRASVLAENLAKWGHPHSVVTNSHTSLFAKRQMFDIVAVDAPCSGEGMMRKDEEAVAQWSPGLVEECAALQRDILDNAFAALKPGGYLVYSTCTFNLAENEDNVDYAVSKYGMESVKIDYDDSWGIIPELKGKNHCMRFMPHSTRGEGLFVAVMRKPDNDDTDFTSKPGKTSSSRFSQCRNEKVSLSMLGDDCVWKAMKRNDSIFAFSPQVEKIEALLHEKVNVVSAGIPIGVYKGKDLIPATELALSTALRKSAFPDIPLSLEDALSYLGRDTVAIPQDTAKGFATVSYSGLILGFIKNIGTRANNLYPKSWRIRMQTK